MVSEKYPCYVRVGESAGSANFVEIPTEDDGTILLSTIAAQFPDAIGLRFKSDTGSWRGVRVRDGFLEVPLEGWGYCDYFFTKKAAGKRKLDSDDGPKSKKGSDLIVLGLPYTTTEDEFKAYFEKYGELAHYEIKTDKTTDKSKGFGFIRYTDPDAVAEVLGASHNIGGRNCEVSYPKKLAQDDTPTKLFIGRLASGTTTEDLRECFSEFGVLKDVYVPKHFRGFGFVTFGSESVAREVLSNTHVIKGNFVNVRLPAPRPSETIPQNMQMQQQQQQQQPQQPQQYGYGNTTGFMQGQQMPPQSVGWYGNQQGNKMNNGYYSQGFQRGGKVQGGKRI